MKILGVCILSILSLAAMSSEIQVKRDVKVAIKVIDCEDTEFQHISYNSDLNQLTTECRPKLCRLEVSTQNPFLGFGRGDQYHVYMEAVPYSLQGPRPSDKEYLGTINLNGEIRDKANLEQLKDEVKRDYIDQCICKKAYYKSGSRVTGYDKIYIE